MENKNHKKSGRKKVAKRKEFESVNLVAKSAQEWKYSAKILNKSLSGFLNEISSLMIKITAILENANVSYRLNDNSLEIIFDGDSRIICGRLVGVSDADIDRKMQELTELKIAEDLKNQLKSEINIKKA